MGTLDQLLPLTVGVLYPGLAVPVFIFYGIGDISIPFANTPPSPEQTIVGTTDPAWFVLMVKELLFACTGSDHIYSGFEIVDCGGPVT